MLIALLLAIAAPAPAPAPAKTAIDAERAFAADAQKSGQWTSFRAYAAPDAMMFVPQPVNAQSFLKDRKDPPVAVFWWPGKSFVSCDGGFAVNSGPRVREWGKSVGYFTTVWRREGDHWRWVYDGGDALEAGRGEGGDIKPVVAPCPANPVPPPPQREMPADVKWGSGSSKDGTLNWFWSVTTDGARMFAATLWDGREHKVVVDDRIAAPPK
jgi:hypothetical protein